MSKRFHIYTYGCQMNRYDTETISGYLEQEGYVPADGPDGADLVLINTCSIREKAEHKVFSQIGRLNQLKSHQPQLKIGVCGCFATRDGEAIAKRNKAIDLVFGTQNIAKLPALLGEMAEGRVIDTDPIEPDFTELAPIERGGALSTFVSIARGCDNYCTFCVVPYTRGPEWSKPSGLIRDEVARTVEEGFKEVTLLGQNVNSYGRKTPGELSFGGLLRSLDGIEGLRRVRFMTSHPKDCDEDMVGAMAECKSVCEHLHLPFQSGSDAVLRRMERGYTAEEYLSKVSLFRERVAEGVLTSDVIVGFPGETDSDFEETLRVMREARYDNIYLFKYSPRPGTPAFSMEDAPPAGAVAERFEEASRLQREMSAQLHEELVGSVQEVMVEGPLGSDKAACGGCTGAPEEEGTSPKLFSGRSRGNHRVQFLADGFEPRPGDVAQVRVQRGGLHVLGGVSPPNAPATEEQVL